MRHFLIAAALVCCGTASAASVVKCVDAAGKVTFAQNECPAGQAVEKHEVKASQRPSGDGPAVKLATPIKPSASPKPRARRTYNHCGDLTQVDIVWAQNRGKIEIGMTGDDVRDTWGPPADINYSADGQQWVYPIDEYKNRYVYIDNRNCFTYWN